MATLIDVTGQIFGKLTVLRYERKKGWICQCECGNECIQWSSYSMRSGFTVSCGCSYPKRVVEIGKKE